MLNIRSYDIFCHWQLTRFTVPIVNLFLLRDLKTSLRALNYHQDKSASIAFQTSLVEVIISLVHCHYYWVRQVRITCMKCVCKQKGLV